jgi:hypothetical protein
MWEILDTAVEARTAAAITKAEAEIRNMEVHTGISRNGTMDFELAKLKSTLEASTGHI